MKYYTPNIEDIFVGYECEVCTNHGFESFNNGIEIWISTIVGFKDNDGTYNGEIDDILVGMDDGYKPVRTKYLTVDDIKAEGWELRDEALRKGEYSIDTFGAISMDDKISTFMFIKSRNGEQVVYVGSCPSINEFRKITKLLNI